MSWDNGFAGLAEDRSELLELAWCDECQAGSKLRPKQHCGECDRYGPDTPDHHPWLDGEELD